MYISHMKIRLLFISLLICSTAAAQQSAVVDYKMYNNTARPNTLDATLYVDNGTTIFFEKYKTKRETSTLPEGTVSVPPKFVFEPYIKINHAARQTLMFQSIGMHIYLVEDSYVVPDWDITTETKNISGYECMKATTTFRGRDWEAWFAPDIALPYGPWKLHSLPGLIMEIRDATNTYAMQVKAINYTQDDIFKEDFTELYNAENDTSITFREFVAMQEEQRANARGAARSKAQPGTTYIKDPGRQGRELKYEWEE